MTTAKNARDLLTGCGDIAGHLGWTIRQVKHRVARRELPVFRIGRTVCASKSYLAEHFRKLSEGQ